MLNKRPKLQIPLSPLEKALNLLVAIAILFCLLLLAVSLGSLPDIIPTHFNVAGQPDGWGSKWTILLFPILALILGPALLFLSRFPQVFNYIWQITPENAARQYQLARQLIEWLAAEIVCLMAYIEWTIIQAARFNGQGLGAWFILVPIVTIFITLGIYFRSASQAR